MNTQNLLEFLHKKGITVVVSGDNILATPTDLVNPYLDLLKAHKQEILNHLNSQKAVTSVTNVTINSEPQAVDKKLEDTETAIYKRYQQPNGSVLELTKKEFDSVVEVFRMLAKQDQKTEMKSSVG